MIAALGAWISRWFGRVFPDPFIIAVALSALTLALALAFGDFDGHAGDTMACRGGALLAAWRSGSGVWLFLSFSMQMCLVLVTGHALAASAPVRRSLASLARLPRTGAGGAAMCATIACTCSVINWGFGLIAGAIMAREIARSLASRSVHAHYPVLVAAGFAGFIPWHGGLSGSAPLSMTSAEAMAKVLPSHTIEALNAVGLGAGVPLSRTMFSGLNLVITGGLMLLVPLLSAMLMPREGGTGPSPDLLDPPPDTKEPLAGRTFAEWLESTRWVSAALGLACLLALGQFLISGKGSTWEGVRTNLGSIGLNEFNLLMLGLGLVLHPSPRSYLRAVDDGARGCAGIILQFPLYAGIVALMTTSGLARQMSEFVVAHAGPRSAPEACYLIACVLNLFIPSGGGQWGVQGPIAIESALRLGVDPGRVVLAVAYGDELTNMLQPFWALPLLAITRVRARDIVGYTTIIMLGAGAWIGLVLWLWPA